MITSARPPGVWAQETKHERLPLMRMCTAEGHLGRYGQGHAQTHVSGANCA